MKTLKLYTLSWPEKLHGIVLEVGTGGLFRALLEQQMGNTSQLGEGETELKNESPNENTKSGKTRTEAYLLPSRRHHITFHYLYVRFDFRNVKG